MLTDDGPLPGRRATDREGTFEPRLIAKQECRFTGFDDKILALKARGMTVREIKIRDEATVRSKPIYLALAVLPDGTRDILGLWIEQTEGAKVWMRSSAISRRAAVRTSSSRSPTA